MNSDNTDELSVEVLMATMRRKDPSFVAAACLECDCTIVNQVSTPGDIRTTITGQNVRMLSVEERGLSRSRNKAIDHATADICLFADDDVTFNIGYLETIREAYSKHPNADIITFQMDQVGDPRRLKHYPVKTKRLGRRGVLRVSSCEIAFRRRSIMAANLCFDTRFGAGADYSMGEETIFLLDALRAGLSIVYVPRQIGSTDVSDSSWFAGFDEAYFTARGAVFRRMSPRLYPILILGFAVTKRRRYEIRMRTAIRCMLRGARQLCP